MLVFDLVPNSALWFSFPRSVGGLVVKRAMADASRADARHSDLYMPTFGILFLATFHHGSVRANIGKILVNTVRISLKQVNKNLLAELEKDNASLLTTETEMPNVKVVAINCGT